jgi:hypothetical protein
MVQPSDDRTTFLSVENLKECEQRLNAYIASQPQWSPSGISDVEVRRRMYAIMCEVDGVSSSSSSTIKSKNNHVMNRVVQEIRQQKQQPQNQKKQQQPQQQQQQQPQQQQQQQVSVPGTRDNRSALMRDHEFFGNREVVTFSNPPPRRANEDTLDVVTSRVLQSYDEQVQERHPAQGTPASVDPVRTEMVDTMTTDDFSKRLKMLESERNNAYTGGGGKEEEDDTGTSAAARALAEVLDTHPSAVNMAAGGAGPEDFVVRRDPPSPLTQIKDTIDHAYAPGMATVAAAAGGKGGAGMNGAFGANDLLPALRLPQTSVIDVRYLTISAADRDFAKQPERFRFTARTSGIEGSSSLMKSYTNISWIEATRIILPMEIMHATGSSIATKGHYRLEFSLAFQYLLLRIDGFDDLCDGTNEAVRRSFAVFVYECDYKAPNGRGYVLLRPAQDERHAFEPAPLASLRDLTLSIMKPNGTLFNGSRDEFTAIHLEYETFNRLFIKVILGQYFDRNEIFVGDYTVIRSFALARRTNDVGAEYVSALEAYITRKQGHEVVQLGSTNGSGFIKAMYILAPGVMDTVQGRVLVDDNIINVIGALGGGSSDADASVYVSVPGVLVNTSLQPVVTMRMGCGRVHLPK